MPPPLPCCPLSLPPCSNDLTQGLRSSARALTAAEQGVRQGVDLAGKAVTGYVVPKIKSTVPEARGEWRGDGREGWS